jgi:hypothetical protein
MLDWLESLAGRESWIDCRCEVEGSLIHRGGGSEGMSRRVWLPMVCLLCVVMVLSGCGSSLVMRAIPPVTTIRGVVLGESVIAKMRGRQALAPAAQATVSCNGITTQTALDGSYFLVVNAANVYACGVLDFPLYNEEQVLIQGGAGTHLVVNFSRWASSICGTSQAISSPASCGALSLVSGTPRATYHHGPVMHTYRAYLIFWVPAGDSFEPRIGNGRYESVIERFFRDVGGTPYYGLLAQYFDAFGPVLNQASLAGAYIDTTPYEHCPYLNYPCTLTAATRADPLFDTDIDAEVDRAIAAQGWQTDMNSEFWVFTANGAQVCDDLSQPGALCTFRRSTNGWVYCGWHGWHQDYSGPHILNAFIADPLLNSGACSDGGATQVTSMAPNGDWAADSAVDSASHELFESVTDPLAVGGWYDQTPQNTSNGQYGEIGDVCEGNHPNIQPDGSDVTLNHSGHFIVQAEWNDQANECALSLWP